jgi:hypothetical protein
MAQKRERAAPRQRTALTLNMKSLDSFDITDTAPKTFRQDPIDVISLLAARSRVSPATIRAQLAAWQIGGAHV